MLAEHKCSGSHDTSMDIGDLITVREGCWSSSAIIFTVLDFFSTNKLKEATVEGVDLKDQLGSIYWQVEILEHPFSLRVF